MNSIYKNKNIYQLILECEQHSRNEITEYLDFILCNNELAEIIKRVDNDWYLENLDISNNELAEILFDELIGCWNSDYLTDKF